MSRFVVDASLALSWFLEDESDREYALNVLSQLSDSVAVVPHLWAYEFTNALVVAQRRKRLVAGQVASIADTVRGLPIELDSLPLDAILEISSIAFDNQLTVYDAAYLELAARLGLPLATYDTALLRAMQIRGVDPVPSSAAPRIRQVAEPDA